VPLFIVLFQVEDNRVLLYLNKRQNKSWYPHLQNGLETAEEEEESKVESTEETKVTEAD